MVIKKNAKKCIFNNLEKRYFNKNIFWCTSSIVNPCLSRKSIYEKNILIKVGDEITRNERMYNKKKI